MRLFISHAKQDGLTLAEEFKATLESMPASRFFDSVDIAPGYDFASEIVEGVKDSILLAILSDAYSSRPWCRREVLTAKRFQRPMVSSVR